MKELGHWIDGITEDLDRNSVMLTHSRVSFQKTYSTAAVWNLSMWWEMWEVRRRLPHIHLEWWQPKNEHTLTIKISKLMSSLDWVLEDEPTNDPSAAHP